MLVACVCLSSYAFTLGGVGRGDVLGLWESPGGPPTPPTLQVFVRVGGVSPEVSPTCCHLHCVSTVCRTVHRSSGTQKGPKKEPKGTFCFALM